MLVLTHDAAMIIRSIVESADVSEGGLRISSRPLTAEQAALDMQVASEPEALDEVVEQEGAHVYLEPAVADALFDKMLDASVEEDGVRFTIVDQSEGPLAGPDGYGPPG